MIKPIKAWYAKQVDLLDPISVEFQGHFLEQAFKDRRDQVAGVHPDIRSKVISTLFVLAILVAFLFIGCFAFVLLYLWHRVEMLLKKTSPGADTVLPHRVADILGPTAWKPKVMEELWLIGIQGTDLVKARYLERRVGQEATPLTVHLTGCAFIGFILYLTDWGWAAFRSPDFLTLLPFLLLLIWEVGWWLAALQIYNLVDESDRILSRWEGRDVGLALTRSIDLLVIFTFIAICTSVGIVLMTRVAELLHLAIPTSLAIGRNSVTWCAAILTVWFVLCIWRRVLRIRARNLIQEVLERANRAFDQYVRQNLQQDADWAREK
jgi:hypothetical protein